MPRVAMPARRMPLPLAVILVLGACAPGAPMPQPLAARLSAGALVLEMSGGQICRLSRAAAARDGAEGWGGPVQGCAGVARVEVVAQRPGPVARLLAPVALGRLIAPRAEVRVTAPDGRVFAFASPPPPHPRD